MFLLNSRPALFTATPESSARVGLHPPGRPISRSYGALLSSSLAEVRPNALGLLSQPTSGGLRYGRPYPIAREAFLVGMGSTAFQARRPGYPQPSAHTPERICLLQLGLQKRTRSTNGALCLPFRTPPRL